MPLIASEVLQDAADLLNDTSRSNGYTDAVLLPYLKKAYRNIEAELAASGLQPLHEISAATTVTAGQTTLTLPNDFVEPVKLEERAVGETRYSPMEQKAWETDEDQETALRYWVYREDEIKFLGATSTRQVRLYYKKSLAEITSASSSIPVTSSRDYLGSRTAALAAYYVGNNAKRAATLQDDADVALDKLIGRQTRKAQSLPVRRIPYSYGRRRKRM